MVAYSVTACSEGLVTDGDRSVFMRNDWMGSETSCTRWISSSLVALSNGRRWRTAAGATSCLRTKQEDNTVSARKRLAMEGGGVVPLNFRVRAVLETILPRIFR